MKKLIFDMVRLENILTAVEAIVADLLWADADVDMERVPCRVKDNRWF